MLICPHCGNLSIQTWRALVTPSRLVCSSCGQSSRAQQAPESLLGQALYLIVVLSVAMLLAFFASRFSGVFWLAIGTAVGAMSLYWYLMATRRPLLRLVKPYGVRSSSLWLFRAIGLLALCIAYIQLGRYVASKVLG